ncbi:Polyadenylate-binding protein 1-like [Balamuthia mandrillaris]
MSSNMESESGAATLNWADESTGSWADEAETEEEEERVQPRSVWGKPVAYATAQDEESPFLDREEFPAPGAQPTRRPLRSDHEMRPGETHKSGAPRPSNNRETYPGRERREFPSHDREFDAGRRGRPHPSREERDVYSTRDQDRGDRPFRREREHGEREGFAGRDRDSYRERDRDRDGERGKGDRYRDTGRAPREKTPFPTSAPWTAFLGNLSYDLYEQDLDDFFSGAGCKIVSIRLMRDAGGRTKGFGYVEFEDAESLKKALEKDDQDLLQRRIRVDVAETKRNEKSEEDNLSWRERAQRAPPAGFARRVDSEPQQSNFRERRADRSQQQHKHPEEPNEMNEVNESSPSASAAAPKKKGSNPFGEAKPRDELAVQKQIEETRKALLQHQKKDEEVKEAPQQRQQSHPEETKEEKTDEAQSNKPQPENSRSSEVSWRKEKQSTTSNNNWTARRKVASGGSSGDSRPRKDNVGRREGGRPPRTGGGDTKSNHSREAPHHKTDTHKWDSRQQQSQPEAKAASAPRKEPVRKEKQPPKDKNNVGTVNRAPPVVGVVNAFSLLTEEEEC